MIILVIHRHRHCLKSFLYFFQPYAIRSRLVDGTGMGHHHHLENNSSLYRTSPSCSVCYRIRLAAEKRNCACGASTLGQHVKKSHIGKSRFVSHFNGGIICIFLKLLLLLISFHLFCIFCCFFSRKSLQRVHCARVPSQRGEISSHFRGGKKKERRWLFPRDEIN